MGRDRYRIHDETAPHFVTCTVEQWLPLFAQPANAQILLDALRYLQREGRLTLYGCVILENHCHLLAAAPGLGKSIASFKSFTARRIVDRLSECRSPVLDLLALHWRYSSARNYAGQEGLIEVLTQW